jgi:organic radical activating enzyme
MESFYTIQGEGRHQGKAAWFIRLGGCDVGCVWCDVKESWPAEDHPQREVAELVQEAAGASAETVVITGGEPLMYDLTALTIALHGIGKRTHLETSGAYPLTGEWDWICVSPKKFKPPLPEILSRAHELKVVVFNKSDFDWAEQHAHLVPPTCKRYLQPEWSKEKQVLPAIIDYVKHNPQWEISLQVHKYMNIP